MPQAPQIPQVPVLTYFDPNRIDRGLVEYWSTETSAYTALDLGTPHPNTRDYAGFRLGLQQAVPFNPGWVRRVYVTDETNPDWFNYQEKFSAESDAHPIFIRNYREDKKTYVPRTKLTPLDTVIKLTVTLAGTGYTPGTFPNLTFVGGGGSGAVGRAVVAVGQTIAELVLDNGGSGYTSAPTFTIDSPPTGTTATGTATIQPQTALLVAEEAKEFQTDSEFFGLFFDVTRVYETLPGPTLTTKTVGQRNLTPEKYRRLIRTEDTDQPVAANYSFPAGLTGDQTQIQLQQETIAKARLKIISEIIAIGSDPILGGQQGEFGPLRVYETVVNEGTPIDEGFGIFKSSVDAFGNGKAVKITVRYPSDIEDRVLEGQELDLTLNLAFPYQERIAPAGEEIGDLGKDIRPIDYFHSRIHELDLRAVNALRNYIIAFPGTANLILPDILEGITATIEETSADGSWVETGDAAWSGAGSSSISFGGSAEASAVVMPALTVRIKQPWAHNIPSLHYMFFLPMPVSAAQVTTRLSELIGDTVLAWPKFKPRMETVTLMGQDMKVNVRVTSHWQDGGGCSSCGGGGSFSTSEHSQGAGSGFSNSVGITIKTVSIPPTIHGAITIGGTLSDSAFGAAAASIGGGTILAASSGAVATAFASVVATISATDDDSTIPTSGKRLLNVDAAPYKYGWARIHVEVVDFADV